MARLLRHVPALIGLGAVLLYALGIVATMGAVRASGLSMNQAFARIPLETHLRNGIAQLAQPMFWVTVGLVLALVLGAGAVGKLAAREGEETPGDPREVSRCGTLTQHEMPTYDDAEVNAGTEPGAEPGERPRWAEFVSRLKENWHFGSAVAMFAFLAATVPWPDAILVVIAGTIFLANPVLSWLVPDNALRRLTVFVAYSGLLMVAVAAGQAFYRSDPLPMAVVSTSTGTLKAPLIASDGGLLYLGPDGHSEVQLYRAVPANRVVRLRVSKRARERNEPSLANMLGIRWR